MKSNKQRNAEIDRKTLINLIRDPDLPEELKRELTDLLLADVLADLSIEELQKHLELDEELLSAAEQYAQEREEL